MNRYFLTGYCNHERTHAISTIEKIISRHGFVTDFKRFSDISLCLTIEIEERKVEKLYTDLKAFMSINPNDPMVSESQKDCMILFNITFTKGTGDMIIEVPPIPG